MTHRQMHKHKMFKEDAEWKIKRNYLHEVKIATIHTTSPWWRLVEKNGYFYLPPSRSFSLRHIGETQTYSYRLYRKLWKIHEIEKIKLKLLGEEPVPF